MRDKVLKLAKRLGKFTLEEIEPILQVDDLENILNELVVENLLILQGDTYFPINKNVTKSELPNFFKFHTKEEIDLILKCFCADIPVLKTILLVEVSKSVVGYFYKYFRDEIYRQQLLELKKYFAGEPKIPSVRTLYNFEVYLYFYSGRIFVANKELKSEKTPKRHSANETRSIRIAYYRVRRIFQNFAFTKSLCEIASEKLWRQEKDFKALEFELRKLLNL